MLGFKPGAPVLEPLYYAAPPAPPQEKKLLARSRIDPGKQADRYTFRILQPQDKLNVIFEALTPSKILPFHFVMDK